MIHVLVVVQFILGLNFISLVLGYCNVTEFETKKNKI